MKQSDIINHFPLFDFCHYCVLLLYIYCEYCENLKSVTLFSSVKKSHVLFTRSLTVIKV